MGMKSPFPLSAFILCRGVSSTRRDGKSWEPLWIIRQTPGSTSVNARAHSRLKTHFSCGLGGCGTGKTLECHSPGVMEGQDPPSFKLSSWSCNNSIVNWIIWCKMDVGFDVRDPTEIQWTCCRVGVKGRNGFTGRLQEPLASPSVNLKVIPSSWNDFLHQALSGLDSKGEVWQSRTGDVGNEVM